MSRNEKKASWLRGPWVRELALAWHPAPFGHGMAEHSWGWGWGEGGRGLLARVARSGNQNAFQSSFDIDYFQNFVFPSLLVVWAMGLEGGTSKTVRQVSHHGTSPKIAVSRSPPRNLAILAPACPRICQLVGWLRGIRKQDMFIILAIS